MMIQVIGAILVIGATTLGGMCFAAREKYRLVELGQMERVIVLMKNRIAYLGTPMTELLEEISWKVGGATGLAIEEISKRMKERQGASAEEIWKEVWIQQGKKSYLTAIDLEEIISFGTTLDFLEKQQQEGSMDMLLFALREKQEIMKGKLQKNGKLYYSMGILSGLLLVVSLL